MKKQRIAFSIDKKMQVLAEVDVHLGMWMDLMAFLVCLFVKHDSE
jgi:hypothetical protein